MSKLVSNAVVSNGLVAAYGMNEASGITVSDSSGSNNNGSVSGATRVVGKFGNGLSFNGSGNMVSISAAPSLDLTTGMTLEAWVNPTLVNGYRTVIMKEITNDHSWAIVASDDTTRPGLWVRIGSNVLSVKGVAPLAVNTWTHLAGTYDGSVLRFYVNGALVGSRNASGSMATSTNPIRIGGNSIWGEYFAGVIDEVRFYNRALSQAEIQIDIGNAIF